MAYRDYLGFYRKAKDIEIHKQQSLRRYFGKYDKKDHQFSQYHMR